MVYWNTAVTFDGNTSNFALPPLKSLFLLPSFLFHPPFKVFQTVPPILMQPPPSLK